MWGKALALAAVLVFSAGQTATSAPAVENGSGWASSSVHGHFGHHRRKVVVIPYPVDRPYFDSDEAPTDEIPVTSPPQVSSAPALDAASACHRSIEKFTVPSEDGGTREITIIRCP